MLIDYERFYVCPEHAEYGGYKPRTQTKAFKETYIGENWLTPIEDMKSHNEITEKGEIIMQERSVATITAVPESSRSLELINSIQSKLQLLSDRLVPVLLESRKNEVRKDREETSPLINRLMDLEEMVEVINDKLFI